MEVIVRAVVIYGFLLLVFRIAGKRSLADITTFDFVLLLIIAETTQQGLLGEDFSLTNAMVLIATLMAIEIGLSLLKRWSPRADRIIEGEPVLLVENGRPLRERMRNELVDEQDVLEAARRWRGIERMEEIKFAILEKDGNITVVARPPDAPRR